MRSPRSFLQVSSALLLWATAPLIAQSLVIRHVTVIDGTGAPPRADCTVVIQNGVIRRVAPGVAVPGAKVVEAKGKYLIPGLWDMHVHLWHEQPMLGMYLRYGVTGVRDMGSPLARTQAWRREIDSGRRVGPKIVTSGPALDGEKPKEGLLPVIPVPNALAGREAVKTLDHQDADFIKVLSGTPRGAFFAIADQARAYHLPFAGHLPDEVAALEACDARMRSMEHMFGIQLACSSDEYSLRKKREEAIRKGDGPAYRKTLELINESYDEQKAKYLFAMFARMHTWQTPTLTLRKRMAMIDLDALVAEAALKEVPEEVRKTWTDPRTARDKYSEETRALYQRDYRALEYLVKVMQREGVQLLAGTDVGDDYVAPGASLHDELALLVKAGLTPMEALQAATRNVSDYFRDERTGTVQAGRNADLVLLDANPLEDIHNTRRISAVIVRGRMYGRDELDRLATK